MSTINYTKDLVLKKLQRYCAYQDRCHKEVRTKLLKMEVYGDLLEDIMAELIKEEFLNEERFAKSYARGKFNVKGWGKVKISVELLKRDISEYCINKGLQEIDDDEYVDKLKELITFHFEKNNHLPPLECKHKAYSYCTRKGFEVDLVLKYLPA